MTQTFERAKSRLSNITAIEPLLSALRTLSMSAWQMSLSKHDKMQAFQDNFNHILVEILPKIKEKQTRRLVRSAPEAKITDTIILIVGTERGLCGKFNKTLSENALTWIESQNLFSYQIWVMGTRMIRELEQENVDIAWRKTLPASEISSYQTSYLLTQNWLEQYEAYNFNNFIILYNKMERGQHVFTNYHLLPYEIRYPSSFQAKESDWPPPIIETDPVRIYHQIIEHFIASSFYQILLESAVAEHSSRYNLMQEALDNAEEIIEELQQTVHNERKRKITQEMQELASGAGLLDN